MTPPALPPPRIWAVVPAAGRSSRFGSMKLLAPIGGRPLLAHTLQALVDAGSGSVLLVTAPHTPPDSLDFALMPAVSMVFNNDSDRGMFSSIQTGLAAAVGLAHGDVVLVLPADMPFVQSATIASVAAESRRVGRPVVPAYGGRRGHPIALSGRVATQLLEADATISLKDALLNLGIAIVQLQVDDAGVLRDVDVPADLI